MSNRLIISLAALAYISMEMYAQSPFENYRDKMRAQYDAFTRNAHNEYENFRRKANEEYSSFLKNAWNEYNAMRTPVRPKDDHPVVPPKPYDDKGDKPVKDTPKPIEDVITPQPPKPQPKPVEPIIADPISTEKHIFSFYGTELAVGLDDRHRFRLHDVGGQAMSDGWEILSDKRFDGVVADCLRLRDEHKLSDWGYLMMLRAMSRSFLGKTNEAVLLMAYVYCQSGYRMRLASDSKSLYMLYASEHRIYDHPYFELNGIQYYPLDCQASRINISQAQFPNEQSLSLYISTEPSLANDPTAPRQLKSARYPAMAFTAASNKNLISFYDDYPTSEIGGDFMSRWAMYAETPLSDDARKSLYPQLRKVLNGKSEREAVEMLLNWVQTAFVYEYDDKVWGHDRAFFADETLYYPYCDCEDRSILFSRLVRDLIGADVVLVYYPGHLATAVNFRSDSVKGDYISLSGRKFVICDPTYINAPVGITMPQMDNGAAKVILLKN